MDGPTFHVGQDAPHDLALSPIALAAPPLDRVESLVVQATGVSGSGHLFVRVGLYVLWLFCGWLWVFVLFFDVCAGFYAFSLWHHTVLYLDGVWAEKLNTTWVFIHHLQMLFSIVSRRLDTNVGITEEIESSVLKSLRSNLAQLLLIELALPVSWICLALGLQPSHVSLLFFKRTEIATFWLQGLTKNL